MCSKNLDFPKVSMRFETATLPISDNGPCLCARGVFWQVYNAKFHEKKFSSKNIYKLFREVENKTSTCKKSRDLYKGFNDSLYNAL